MHLGHLASSNILNCGTVRVKFDLDLSSHRILLQILHSITEIILPIKDAAFPVKAITNTLGFNDSSSSFKRMLSAHLLIASIVMDFPTPIDL